MADYYTRTVITGAIPLTDEMLAVVEARSATVYPQDEEGILDALANVRQPLKTYHVVFEDGWLSQFSNDVDEEIGELGIEDDVSDEFKRLIMLDEADFLHESLKLSETLDHIEMQSGFGCSEMRLDGFGGSGLIVTRKGYLYITTSNWELNGDGTAEHRGKFHPWEDADDRTEAA